MITTNKNPFLLIVGITLLILNLQVIAQESIQEKLNSIKGDVNKITITEEGGEIIFEGKEAAQLFEKLRQKEISLECISEGDKDITWVMETATACGNNDSITKEIKVEINDDVKKVTIKTTENGEEKTEVMEGKEADNYLEKLKDKKGGQLKVKLETDKKGKCIILETDEDNKVFETDSSHCIKIKMDCDKGIKKIKIDK